jgi:glycosyltransferase involved in cell wall biosynthesis
VRGRSRTAWTESGRMGTAMDTGPRPTTAGETTVDISVVVPVLDEVDSIERLCAELTTTLEELGVAYEIIVVDDGSTDGTAAALFRLAEADPRLRVVELRRNFGQTAAIAAGFDFASGAVVIPMDGDLQNDPADIPRLLDKLDEGYDLVSGWRKERKEGVVRTVPSHVANWLIGVVTGVRLHDYGCTMKAYRAEIVKDMRLYGEMHRFMPAFAYLLGARIAEIPIRHHARQFGRSKYGLTRTFKVVLDLITVRFLSSSGTKPSYLFGGIGSILCLLGTIAGAFTLYDKWADGVYVHRNPLILLAVFLFLLGVNFILMGLLAELIIRTYHESQQKPIYWVRSLRNLPNPGSNGAR